MNSGKFAYICHFQQIGINATKIEKTGIHFKTDVFTALAVVDAKAPYVLENHWNLELEYKSPPSPLIIRTLAY